MKQPNVYKESKETRKARVQAEGNRFRPKRTKTLRERQIAQNRREKFVHYDEGKMRG